jgi:predicted PurR-regulated permease PerM
MFVAKVLYVIFWTFVLNTLCNYGYYKLSWFILLLPFIIFFIVIAVVGQFINKQTTNISGSGANYMGQGQQQASAQQQQQYYTYQQQASSAQQAQKQQKDNSQQQMQPQYPEQEQTGQTTGSYSSYGDYDRALDDKTKQMYNDSNDKGEAQYHY